MPSFTAEYLCRQIKNEIKLRDPYNKMNLTKPQSSLIAQPKRRYQSSFSMSRLDSEVSRYPEAAQPRFRGGGHYAWL